MRLFLDSADTEVIKEYHYRGLVDGVTTNPSLILKSGRKPEDVYTELLDMGIEDISAEVVGETYEEMITMAKSYVLLGGNITIKVPCTIEGLKVCRELTDKGYRVNVTLVFSPSQALLAAKCGATYVSPFYGRCEDKGISGKKLIRDISSLFIEHSIDTKILSASIRDTDMVVQSFKSGADIVTLPPKVLDDMYNHFLTDEGLKIFNEDWKSVVVAEK